MKVLDLRCAQDHRFEGWFGSEDDYQSQRSRGLVQCPVCSDHNVNRLPSAPRLNVSGAVSPRRESGEPGRALVPKAAPSSGDGKAMALQAAWLQAVRHVMENTVDVGERFAEEARRIHYGESEERAIRGQATPDEAQSLRDEGIEVVSLPVPALLKDRMQ